MLFYLLKRDFKRMLYDKTLLLKPLVFFVLVQFIFSASLSFTPSWELSVGISWASTLLAGLMSVHTLLEEEYQKGYLDMYLLSPHSLALILAARMLCGWLSLVLPIIMVASICLWVEYSWQQVSLHALTLTWVSMVMVVLNTIVLAMTIILKQSGLLLPIVVLPFIMPLVLLSMTALNALEAGALSGYLALLAAIWLFCVSFGPMVAGFVLRFSIKQG